MANRLDLTAWKNRWGTLNKTIDSYSEQLQRLVPEPPDTWTRILLALGLKQTVPGARIFLSLAEYLQTFADRRLNRFHNDFGDYIPSESDPPQYPPEYVFRVTLDQIAYDLEVIQRAANQRIQGTDKMKETLDKADRLAREALKPVVGADRLVQEGTTVITYFHKSANIRVIPYAPVALIGIPFTCIGVPRDYLATPHEVGHYVFRHGKVGEEPLHEVLREDAKEVLRTDAPEDSRWCYLWLEEIFADVCGALIAGPMMALDFQDLLLEKSQEEFIEDDQEHPVPVLRPYIYTKVLEKRKLGDWATSLNERWEDCLTRRGNPSGIKPKGSDAEVKLADARPLVGKIVDVVLDKVLKDQNFAIDSNWWKSAYSKLEPPENFNELEKILYGGFKNHVEPPELPESLLDELELAIALQLVPVKEVPEGEDPTSFWANALLAEGWTTKGPHGRI